MQPGIADIAEPVVEFVDIELDMDFDKHFVVDKPAVVRFDPCRKVRFDLVLVRLVAGQKKMWTLQILNLDRVFPHRMTPFLKREGFLKE